MIAPSPCIHPVGASIRAIPCRVVVDHMGRLDPHLGTGDPAYPVLCRLLDRGNVYVKLSGPYLNTVSGEPWDDATAVAVALAEFAPERVVWGTDYPHVTEEGKEAVEMKPGDCINIPAEVKHWHGATPDEWFSHLAIEVPGENGSNEWLEPVSDEEYGKLQ